MNQRLIVRKGEFKDSTSVYRLLCLVADLHRDGRPDMFPNLKSKYTLEQVSQRLTEESSGIIIAESDCSVVGYIFCDVIKEGDGLTLYVDDLCVDPSVRCMGVGRALLDYAAHYGKENGCRCLMLNVWEFNKTAVDFYLNYGLETRSRHLEMLL